MKQIEMLYSLLAEKEQDVIGLKKQLSLAEGSIRVTKAAIERLTTNPLQTVKVTEKVLIEEPVVITIHNWSEMVVKGSVVKVVRCGDYNDPEDFPEGTEFKVYHMEDEDYLGSMNLTLAPLQKGFGLSQGWWDFDGNSELHLVRK